MFLQRMCRFWPPSVGAPGTSGRVLPARGQWQSCLGIPNRSGSPCSLFQVRILDEQNSDLLLSVILKYLPRSQGIFCRMLAQGNRCPGEILEPVRWPLASGFELLLQSPSVGTQKERLLSLRGPRIPSQGIVFPSTKQLSSCAPQGSGPSTPAERLRESTGISGSTGRGRSRGEGSPALVKSEAVALGKQGASSSA